MASDYTIHWESGRWQIPKTAVHAGLRGSRIQVLRRLDGAVMARIGGACVELRECGPAPVAEIVAGPQPEPKRYVPKPGQSRWMDGFCIARHPPAQPSPLLNQPNSSRPPGSLRRADLGTFYFARFGTFHFALTRSAAGLSLRGGAARS